MAVRYEYFDDDDMADTSQSWSIKNRYSIGVGHTRSLKMMIRVCLPIRVWSTGMWITGCIKI